jgi:antitoxin component YwqK of YwqJK toxin-antitoxin module
MKKLIVFVMIVGMGIAHAQQERTLKLNKEKKLIEVTYYHDNGDISQTGYYTLDGKLHGEWFSYSEEGNKLVSAEYKNGEKVGKWFFWSGNVLREVDYSKNTIASINEWVNADNTLASNR